jgi:hypothetical protein
VSEKKRTTAVQRTTRSRGTSWHTARAVVASFLITDRSIDWMDGSFFMVVVVVVEEELVVVVDFGNRNKCAAIVIQRSMHDRDYFLLE